jgi:hypothetical protein
LEQETESRLKEMARIIGERRDLKGVFMRRNGLDIGGIEGWQLACGRETLYGFILW